MRSRVCVCGMRSMRNRHDGQRLKEALLVVQCLITDSPTAPKLVPYWHYVRDILMPQIRAAQAKATKE